MQSSYDLWQTLSYEPSRFISEIPAEYLEEREAKNKFGFGIGQYE